MRYAILLISAAVFILSCSSDRGYDEYRVLVEPEVHTIHPGGESYFAVKIEIRENTYIYANPKGPGTGLPVEVSAMSDGPVEIYPSKYPEGKKYTAEGEDKHVFIHKDEVYLFIPFAVDEDAPEGKYSVEIKAKSLTCDYSACFPMSDELTAYLKIDKTEKPYTHSRDIHSLYSKASFTSKQKHPSSEDRVISAEAEEGLFDAVTLSPRFFDAPVRGIIQAVLFGLIAGFILNFMPCVLPVVSLKIMGLVKSAGSSRRSTILTGSLFSGGILFSFTLLAVLMAFFGYNWGGLFQYDGFLIAMTAIVFALALSMFGVYTINVPGFAAKAASVQPGNPYVDAFGKGLLATLLATPCSGPFLGGTLAWTLTQPPHVIFIIFISIGTGMAFPYLVLTIKPELLKFIPRPGPWTIILERVMGFLLIFTVIYLINVVDSEARMPLLLFLVFLAMGLYQYGRYGLIAAGRVGRWIPLALLVIIIVSGYWFSFGYIYGDEKGETLPVVPYTEERLFENREKGVISMVKFTADWCPNCRIVERRALNRSRTIEKIESEDVDFLTADITRTNIPAERLLNKTGLYSIPVLMIFPPGEDFKKPLVLRDIYSMNDVLTALDRVK